MTCLLRAYVRERSPIWLILPLSFVLFFAGTPSLPVDGWTALRGWFSAIVLLLLARLSDDMADIPIDRITHPQRVLCKADVADVKKVQRVQWGLVGLVIVLQIPATIPLAFMLALLALYTVFFAFKSRLPIIVQTLAVNGALAALPIYGELVLTGIITPFGGLMGLFFWLGALAHEYSHSLQETRSADPARLNPINRLNPKSSAIGSLWLFVLCGFIGGLLYGLRYTGPLFLLLLLGCCTVMICLEIRLIRKPSRATAAPFYWFGYVYFLLPALGHIASAALASNDLLLWR